TPDAYRIALIVSPRKAEPFFIQIPPYSDYCGKLRDVSFPAGAMITAPRQNQEALGLIGSDSPICPSCGHKGRPHRKGKYADGSPRLVCANCKRVLDRDLQASIHSKQAG
ncbi:MAG: hypothetical protein AAFY26_26645, partial [Cyanobacteria bacterium J06638_22]